MSPKTSASNSRQGSQALKKDRDNNTGLNMLRTVNFIYKNASADKPVTISQISSRLKISPKVVSRLLINELSYCQEIKLVSLCKHKNEFIEEDEYLARHNANPIEYPILHKCRYFYIQNTWNTKEILTLTNAIDMIECVNPVAARSIISKLASYNDASSCGRENNSDEFISEYPRYKYLGSNLSIINHAISSSQYISFFYGKYNSNLMLVSQENVKVAPIAVMHYHSYYYLIAYCPAVKDIRHYRIERIVRKVKLIQSSFKKLPEFEKLKAISASSILSYTAQNVKMQGGVKARVTMVCSERIANNFVDAFGAPDSDRPQQSMVHTYNYTITKHSPNDHSFHDEDGTFTVEFRNVTIDGIVIWASQFCADCEILTPEECRNSIRERISKANERYSQSPFRSR